MEGNTQREPPREEGSLDGLLRALADKRRRAVLRYFQSMENNVATVTDLVEHTTQECLADHKNQEVIFAHVTLPYLAENGLVDYDDENGIVTYQRNRLAEQIMRLIS